MKFKIPFNLIPTCALSDVLCDNFQKVDLTDLCDRMLISYYKSDNKKTIASEYEDILLSNPFILTDQLPKSELEDLRRLVKSGGMLETKEPLYSEMVFEMGLIFPELTIPDEIKVVECGGVIRYAMAGNLLKVLEPIIDEMVDDEEMAKKDRSDKLMLGMFNIYGILTERNLKLIWKQVTGETLSTLDVLRMVMDRNLLKREILPVKLGHEDGYYNSVIPDPKVFYRDIKVRKELEYAIYPVDLYLQCAELHFDMVDVKIQGALVSVLKQLNNGSIDRVIEQMSIIWECTQLDIPFKDMLGILLDEFVVNDISQVQKLMGVMTEYTNNLPLWLLKGNSPESIHKKNPLPPYSQDGFMRNSSTPPHFFQPTEPVRPSVGRNDLCPCGSGKKYKKCCGAN